MTIFDVTLTPFEVRVLMLVGLGCAICGIDWLIKRAWTMRPPA